MTPDLQPISESIETFGLMILPCPYSLSWRNGAWQVLREGVAVYTATQTAAIERFLEFKRQWLAGQLQFKATKLQKIGVK